jgi:hypothetical protein
LSSLWSEWQDLGAHLVEEGWTLPRTGQQVFTESGTYAPVFHVGPFTGDDGATHLFLCDGYSASAEAMQAASLDPILDLSTSMCLFSSHFKASVERERHIIALDPESGDFEADLAATLEKDLTPELSDAYRASLRSAREALMPVDRRTITADDFFPLKECSDSGRIRNELQTLCSEAIEYLPDDRMLLRFDQIDDSVLPHDKKELIREVLTWYKANHPIWFTWLEMK